MHFISSWPGIPDSTPTRVIYGFAVRCDQQPGLWIGKRTGQKMSVLFAMAQRMEEASVADPPFLLDQLVMHNGDVSGCTAEADPSHLAPET